MNHVIKLVEHIAIMYPVFIILFTLHGGLQACASYLMGNHTARLTGFTSFNPLRHLDPVTLLFLVSILSLMQFGGLISALALCAWILGLMSGMHPLNRMPLDPEGSEYRRPRLAMLVVALTGILTYFVIWRLCVFMVILSFVKYTPLWLAIGSIFTELARWTFFFGIISLIPVPPLEASMLWYPLFGQKGLDIYYWLEERSPVILLTLLIVYVLWSGF